MKIPGMHRPAAGDLRKSLRPEEQDALAEPLGALDAALERGDDADGAREALPQLEPELGEQPRATRSSTARSRPTRTGARRRGSGSR